MAVIPKRWTVFQWMSIVDVIWTNGIFVIGRYFWGKIQILVNSQWVVDDANKTVRIYFSLFGAACILFKVLHYTIYKIQKNQRQRKILNFDSNSEIWKVGFPELKIHKRNEMLEPTVKGQLNPAFQNENYIKQFKWSLSYKT